MGTHRRYLLDQNFPVNLVRVMSDFMPPDVELVHVPEIDTRLSDVSDRELILWASRQEFDALVSTNFRMVNQPDEVAAMVHTKLTMVFTHKMGHSPLRASGALFLELPKLHDRLRRGSNVFMLRYDLREPQPAWRYLQTIANRRRLDVDNLWRSVQPTQLEATADLLN